MPEVVTITDSAHWYERDGTPAYTRKTKDGRERPTTLRDARKENLFPSVTTVLGVMAAPFLERWKLENLLTASLTLPKQDDEDVQAYAARVWEDAQTVGAAATGFGTDLHDAIELRLRTGTLDNLVVKEGVEKHIERFDAWAKANVIRVLDVEFSVVGKEGYAGKCDALIEHQEHGLCYVDWKSQNVKRGKPNFYDKWVQQLSAYRHAHGQDAHLLSVVMDKNEPTDPVEKLWTEDESSHGLEVFHLALKLWQVVKNYKPEWN